MPGAPPPWPGRRGPEGTYRTQSSTPTVRAPARGFGSRAVRVGFRQLRASRELSVLTFGLGASNFAYSAVIAVFVLYANQRLHLGPVGYGALFAALATGGVFAGWLGTPLLRGRPAWRTQAATLLAQGTSWGLVAVFANVWATAALVGCVGAAATLNSASLSSACQRLAPEGSLGRIVALFRICGVGAGGAGALAGGWVAAHTGLSAPLVVAATIQLTAAVTVWLLRSGESEPGPASSRSAMIPPAGISTGVQSPATPSPGPKRHR